MRYRDDDICHCDECNPPQELDAECPHCGEPCPSDPGVCQDCLDGLREDATR